MFIQVYSVPYATMKAHLEAHPSSPRWYCSQDFGYLVWCGDTARLYSIEAETSTEADKTDFETNYKAGSVSAASRDEVCYLLAKDS